VQREAERGHLFFGLASRARGGKGEGNVAFVLSRSQSNLHHQVRTKRHHITPPSTLPHRDQDLQAQQPVAAVVQLDVDIVLGVVDVVALRFGYWFWFWFVFN
jgi:hypothetical protein